MLGRGYDPRAFYTRNLQGGFWQKTYSGAPYKPEAQGKLMNLRLAQALFEDEWMKEQPFEGKPVAIQSCSQGPLGGARMQYHWRMSMTFLKAFIFGTPEVFVGNAATKFNKDTLELTDQGTKDAVKAQLTAFVKFIRRMKAGG